MSKASKLIKRLDKLLKSHASFGDNPDGFIEQIMSELDGDYTELIRKSKPEHWAEIYVERDRARIKQMILNRMMSKGSD